MIVISNLKIPYLYSNLNRYEVDQNSKILVGWIKPQYQQNALLEIHSLEEVNFNINDQEYLIALDKHRTVSQVDDCDWIDNVIIYDLHQNNFLIHLQGQTYFDESGILYIQLFYYFNSITKEIKIIHKIKTESIVQVRFPLILELKWDGHLIIHELSDIHDIKIKSISDCCSFNQIFYKGIKTLVVNTLEGKSIFLGLSLEAVNINPDIPLQTDKSLSLFLRQYGRFGLKMKITVHDELMLDTNLDTKFLGSSKEIYVKHDKIFIIKRHLKLLRSLQTQRNTKIQNSRFILQWGDSNEKNIDVDSIYNMITAERVIAFQDACQQMICRKNVIFRFFQSELSITKISIN